MNVTISRLKKYAECANACYALFDKDEFLNSYIDMKKKEGQQEKLYLVQYAVSLLLLLFMV